MNRDDEALEYLMQSYLIYVKRLGEDAAKVKEIWGSVLELGKKLSYSPDILTKRLTVQSKLLEHRYDERIDKREQELIEGFGL